MFCGTFPAQALYVGKRNAQWAAQKKVGRGSYGAFHHPELTVTILVFKSMVLRYTHTILVSIIMTNIS